MSNAFNSTKTIEPSVTTGPITGSAKAYRELADGGRVPFRRVTQTNGETLDLYDTSGTYTDATTQDLTGTETEKTKQSVWPAGQLHGACLRIMNKRYISSSSSLWGNF